MLALFLVCVGIAVTYGYTRLAHYTMTDVELLVRFWPRWLACVAALALVVTLNLLVEAYD
jgi:hypothetical protein